MDKGGGGGGTKGEGGGVHLHTTAEADEDMESHHFGLSWPFLRDVIRFPSSTNT